MEKLHYTKTGADWFGYGIKASHVDYRQLTLDMRTPVFFTNSQVALYWILSKTRLRPSKPRRADLVHQAGHSDVNYIRTRLNPAEALASGKTVKKLVVLCYYNGPPFPLTEQHEWLRHEI